MKRTILSVTLSFASLANPLLAQQGVSPGVQRLYADARAAQAAERNDDAVADYLKMIRLSPKLGAAYNNLGRLYYNTGHYTDAIHVLSQGLAIDPAMHPAEIILGASYYQAGNYDKATSTLEAALKALPEDQFARITLVHTLMQQNKNEEAVQQLHRLLQSDKKDQEAWYLLGKLQLQLSQQAFAQVHAIDPNSPISHELSGEIMESMKNTPGAIAEYKQALQVSPKDVDATEHLANVYWSTGDWSNARDLYLALLQQGDTNCLIRWKLANTLNELNESSEDALRQVDQAIATCPALAQARVERARVLLRLNRAADALPELQTAEKTAPDEPSIQFLLSRVYKALGDPSRSAAADARFKQLLEAEHGQEERHAADVMKANP